MPIRYVVSPRDHNPELTGAAANQPAVSRNRDGTPTVFSDLVAYYDLQTDQYFCIIKFEGDGADLRKAGIVDILDRDIASGEELNQDLLKFHSSKGARDALKTRLSTTGAPVSDLRDQDPMWQWLNRLVQLWEPDLDIRNVS